MADNDANNSPVRNFVIGNPKGYSIETVYYELSRVNCHGDGGIDKNFM